MLRARCWALMLALITFLGRGEAAGKPATVDVVAYLPEWRYEGANWDVLAQHTSHLILFSLEMTSRGVISAKDRLPRAALMRQARDAATQHGTRLMICFGGNGRSAGFDSIVHSKKKRGKFVKQLVELMVLHQLDGVDYNWEYPGYVLGKGNKDPDKQKADYKGLARLIRDTRSAFAKLPAGSLPSTPIISIAYYPDKIQEKLLVSSKVAELVDLCHIMAYDQGGAHHSSLEFGKAVALQGIELMPSAKHKLTLGLPFYGRDRRTGDWTTYEDLVQQHAPLAPHLDFVSGITFNGVDTISAKTVFAIEQEMAGVMIWEGGQDCRLQAVTHGTVTHTVTCPDENASLLVAVSSALRQSGSVRSRVSDWRPSDDHDEL